MNVRKPEECRHRCAVRLRGAASADYVCVTCGKRWCTSNRENVPVAPAVYRRRSLEELQLWYVRVVLKARI